MAKIIASPGASMTMGLNDLTMKIAKNEILGCFRVLLGPVDNVCALSPRLFKAVCEKHEFGGVAVGTVVALKVMPMYGDGLNEFEKSRKRIASLGNLSHPGIEKYHGCFPVYDCGGDYLVLVSEWLEGESLKDRLLRNPQGIDADEALRIGAQLLSALTYLSSKGFVHRDIKPTNIFLSKDGSVKLVGLDRSSLDLNLEVNEDACPVGTFNYMASDFLNPSFHGDIQSDIFSTGVCLHEMLSGQLPYRKEVIGVKTLDGWEQLRQRTGCADAIQIDKRIDEILIGAVEVLGKALRTNREERYLTFADFTSAYKGIRRRKMPQYEDGKSVSLVTSAGRLFFRSVSAATARVLGKIRKSLPFARMEGRPEDESILEANFVRDPDDEPKAEPQNISTEKHFDDARIEKLESHGVEKRVDSFSVESEQNQSTDLFKGEDAVKMIREAYDSDDNRSAFPTVDYAAFERSYFAVFGKEGKKGVVEKHSGTVVVNPVFEDIAIMYDCRGRLIDNVINVKNQGQWRLYRLGYGYPIAPQFVYLGRLREGVRHALYRGKLHGFVDGCQRISLPFVFADAKSFSEGVCAVKWNPRDEYDGNNGWGYVDHAGKCIVRGSYLDACEFRRGFACVQEPDMSLGRVLMMRNLDTCSASCLGRYLDGMRWGIIDKRGRTILPCGSDLDEVHSVLRRLRHPGSAVYKLQEYVPSKDNIAIASDFVFVRDARDMVIAIDHKGDLLSEGKGEATGVGVIVEGWKNIRQVSAGFDHAMGLTSHGDVVSTWNTREFTKKAEVCAWRNVVLMDSCEGHVAAVMSDGRVVCVAEKGGFERPTDYSEELKEIRNAQRVAVGWNHAAVLLTDGTVKIVGRHCRANQCEEWKDVVDVDVFGCYYSPSQTVGLTASGRVLHMLGESTPDLWRDIVSVSCGNQFIVAMDKFGKVYACGCNNRGQCDVAGWPQMICVRGDFATTVAIDRKGWVWMTPIGKTQHNVFGVDGQRWRSHAC